MSDSGDREYPFAKAVNEIKQERDALLRFKDPGLAREVHAMFNQELPMDTSAHGLRRIAFPFFQSVVQGAVGYVRTYGRDPERLYIGEAERTVMEAESRRGNNLFDCGEAPGSDGMLARINGLPVYLVQAQSHFRFA